MSTLVGFFIGYHDSNIAMLRDGEFRYRKFERRSGIKHERVQDFGEIARTLIEWDATPDLIAFSDGDWNGLGICPQDQLWCPSSLSVAGLGVREIFCVDHHYAHALSSWPSWKGREPGVFRAFALDGKGDHGIRARMFEIGLGLDAQPLWTSQRFAVGDFFTEIGRRLSLDGNRVDMAGKIMGLQAYGNIDLDWAREASETPTEWITSDLLMNTPWRGKLPVDPDFCPSMEDVEHDRNFLDWLATVHYVLGEYIRRAMTLHVNRSDFVTFTGGCAQNSVYNERLARHFTKLAIPAHCYDGGLSLGLVAFLARKTDTRLPDLPSYPFIQDDEDCGYASTATQERVAALIASGAVVGWMQGHGEAGPRALGHRSMLYDPRRHDAKDVLNGRVKFREPWRPFAASVPLRDAETYFDLEGGASPWMQRALPVTDDAAEWMPGVVHRDGTCRAQTVDPDEAEMQSYHGLLNEVAVLTGHPAVLNTSLNTGGEPIYGSQAQGRALLASGRIDALCVGDELYERTS